MASISKYLRPPTHSDYAKAQKKRYLHIALLTTIVASFLIALINITHEAYELANFLFFISGFLIFCIVLNHHNRYYLSATLLMALVYIAMMFNLIDGAGLSDPGIAVFPIYIILASFIYGKWAAPISTLISMASIYGLYFGHHAGIIILRTNPSSGRTMTISILVAVCGILYWTITDSWEKMMSDLRTSYELTLRGWGRALELRDFETEGHSLRVETLSVALAEKLGCKTEEIEYIRYGAYLHDIGKMAIPDDILFKPEALNEKDWDVMKQHPVHGKNMVQDIPFLKPSIPIILSHHERWDGAGYPEELEGEEIPLGARIFSIIDVWDALNSNRIYRDAWPEEKIKQYLQEHAGKRFDPKIVTAFLELLEDQHAK